MKIKRRNRIVLALTIVAGLLVAIGFANTIKSDRETFADNKCTADGNLDISCGNTAREKYWIALGKYFDDNDFGDIHKAGIMGNMWEEGQFSPTSWECSRVISGDGSGRFIVSWDTLYNHAFNTQGDDNAHGVGSVGITWDLSVYLHWLNDNAPDLLEYLKNPTQYTYNYCRCDGEYCGYTGSDIKPGDQTLSVIGEEAFNKFVEYEVTYMIEYFEAERDAVTQYKNETFATPSDAAVWWFNNYEKGVGMTNARLQEAEKAYSDFKDRDFAAECNSNAISQYVIDSNNKYLELTDFKDSITGFENLFAQGIYSVDADTKTVGGKQVPYTGGKTKLYRNGVLAETYANIVRGDTTGDGIIGIQDYIEIRKDIMNNANGLKNEYRVAGDMDKNNLITIIDYTRIRKILMQ